MKKCENCIHCDLCREYYYVGEPCAMFKDKSKFIELPCAIGDTIWCVTKNMLRPIAFEIMDEPQIPIYHSLLDTFVRISDFGNIAFLTREEAEKKLEELTNEKE